MSSLFMSCFISLYRTRPLGLSNIFSFCSFSQSINDNERVRMFLISFVLADRDTCSCVKVEIFEFIRF